jgi:tetratricopeptide (TPR) repeat protein
MIQSPGRSGMRALLFLGALLLAVLTFHTDILYSQTEQDDRAMLRMAQQYERAGDYRNAARLFERLYERQPDHFTYFDGYRRMLMQLREYDEAITVTENRLADNPRDVNLQSLLGSMYYRAEQRERAFEIWERTLETEPRNMVAYQMVASQLMENRLLEQAIDVYKRGREIIGQPYLFANDLAFLYASTMNYRGATNEYLLLLEHTPQQLSFIQSRMSMYVLRNDGLEQAIDVAEQKAHQHADQLHFQRFLAWLYREAKAFDKAYEIYKHIDRSQNARGAELYSFAQTAYREREYEVAAGAFQDILGTYPDFDRTPQVRFGYARCLEEMSLAADSLRHAVFPAEPPPGSGRVAEMRASYDRVIETYRDIFRSYEGSDIGAQALFRIGVLQYHWYFDLDGALETMQEVVRLYSRGQLAMEARALLGDLHIVRGDLDEALGQFNLLLESSGITEEFADYARLKRAEIAFYRGAFDESLEEMRELVQKSSSSYANNAIELHTFILENREPAIRGVRSDDALEQYARAMHRKKQQRYPEAIATLEYIIGTYPDALLVDDAIVTAGDLYFAMQRYDEAIAAYRRIDTIEDRSILRDRALMRIAEVYHYGLGEREKAIKVYEDIIIEHPRSLFATEARKRIRLLRGDPS